MLLTVKSILSKFSIFIVFLTAQVQLHADALEFHDVRKQLWCSGLKVVNASYTWQDAARFIQQSPEAVKNWTSDTTPFVYCSLVHSAPWGRIWTLGFLYSLNALFIRDMVMPIFNKNDYILIPFWGEVIPNKGYYKALIKNARFPQNIFFLGNSDECTEILRAEGVQAFTVSHNAFIDRSLYRPMNTERKYDAIYVGDCRPQKRVHLASSILPNLLVLTMSDMQQRSVVAGAKQIIYNPFPSLIPQYINEAHCGLILSEREGGCYVSTEYLYCGVPVVSTSSIGGRDAYYDEITALIVDDTPADVRRGVEIMCRRETNPWEVRRRALAVSDQMLDTLAYQILLPIFKRYGDPNAADPRGFINAKMNNPNHQSTKGRTVFQPETPTHDRIEKIKYEQLKSLMQFQQSSSRRRK